MAEVSRNITKLSGDREDEEREKIEECREGAKQ